MASSPLTVDNLVGRQIKLLGRVQQVVNSNSNVKTIFTTGDSDFPYQSTFVAYIGIVSSDGLAITTEVAFGASGGTEWSGGAANVIALASPVVLFCSTNGPAAGFVLPVYSQGVPFQASISVGAGGSQLLEFSAYGFAF